MGGGCSIFEEQEGGGVEDREAAPATSDLGSLPEAYVLDDGAAWWIGGWEGVLGGGDSSSITKIILLNSPGVFRRSMIPNMFVETLMDKNIFFKDC